MASFDWSFLWAHMGEIGRGLEVTVEATFAGTALAMVLGLLVVLARRSRHRTLNYPVSFLREIVQNTPLLIQLFLVFYVFPQYVHVVLSPFLTGVIVLGIHYATYTSEVYRAGIDAVPTGQWEASRALNFSHRDTWVHLILPQAIPPVVPALGNYLISMFKDTPQLLAIGLLEMVGTARSIGDTYYRYKEVFTAAGLIFIALSFASSLAVRRLENRFGQLHQ